MLRPLPPFLFPSTPSHPNFKGGAALSPLNTSGKFTRGRHFHQTEEICLFFSLSSDCDFFFVRTGVIFGGFNVCCFVLLAAIGRDDLTCEGSRLGLEDKAHPAG